VLKLIQSLSPSEVIFSKGQRTHFERHFDADYATFLLDDWAYAFDYAHEKLLQQFKTASLKGFGVDGLDAAIIAAGAVLHYLEATEHRETHHIASLSRMDEETYVWLDKFTIRNLELVASQNDGGVPLLQILDQTVTPMGSRLLRKWMVLPLKDRHAIEERLTMVDVFFRDRDLADKITGYFHQVSDLERLISKVAVGRINPRELIPFWS
jgi:DNA mismatch repair protein MutS